MLKTLCPLLVSLPFLLMAEIEETIAIIKPDAVNEKHIGDIITRYEKEGFTLKRIELMTLRPRQAEQFYQELAGKPFYNDLVAYMTSGPVVVLLLRGDEAVVKNRQLIGLTDPKTAAPNTLRQLFGKSKSQNALHGSDSKESAKRESDFFFHR